MPLWGLSAAQAGLMASAFAFGYMVAVPLLTTLTDRIDARYMLMTGSVLSGLATVIFGLIADDLLSATVIWGIAGVGFAGAYMPGRAALAWPGRLPMCVRHGSYPAISSSTTPVQSFHGAAR
jgi:predicted MFS family arabinose efflux permease